LSKVKSRLTGKTAKFSNSLLVYAVHQNLLSDVEKDAKWLLSKIAKDHTVLQTLRNRSVPRKAPIKELYKQGKLNTLTVQFLFYLDEANQMEFLREILADFLKLVVDYRREVPITITLAKPVDEKSKEFIDYLVGSLKSQYLKEDDKTVVTTIVDPSIKGGYKANIGGATAIDQSIATAIRRRDTKVSEWESTIKNASVEEINKSVRQPILTENTKEWLEAVQKITDMLAEDPQNPGKIELKKIVESGLGVLEYTNPYGDMPSLHGIMVEVRKLIKSNLVVKKSPEKQKILAEFQLKMENAANEQEEKSIVAQYKAKLAAVKLTTPPKKEKPKAATKPEEVKKAETKKEETKKEGTKKEGPKKDEDIILRAPVQFGLPYLRDSPPAPAQSLKQQIASLVGLVKSRVRANPVIDEWMYARKIIDWKKTIPKLSNGREKASMQEALKLFEKTVLPVEWKASQTNASIENLKKLSAGQLAELAPEVLHSIPKEKLQLLPLAQLDKIFREQAHLNEPIDIEQIRKINFKTLDPVDVDVIMLEVNNHYSSAAFEKREAIARLSQSTQLNLDPSLMVHVPRAELQQKYKLSIPKSTEEKFVRNAAYKKEVEAKCLDAGITPLADIFKLSHTL
jgi:F0F1-type ATP synthase delta subunit